MNLTADPYEMACYAPLRQPDDRPSRPCMTRFTIHGQACPTCGNSSREFLVIIKTGDDLSSVTGEKLANMYDRIHPLSKLWVGPKPEAAAVDTGTVRYASPPEELQAIRKQFASDLINAGKLTDSDEDEWLRHLVESEKPRRELQL